MKQPELPARLIQRFSGLHRVLMNKYYFDWFNENVLARASRGLGQLFWKVGDQTLIDGGIVNGSARTVGVLSATLRKVQTGRLYNYAFAMIIGLAVIVGWLVFRV